MVPGPQQGRKGQPLRWTLRQEGWPGKGPPQLGAPTREDPGEGWWFLYSRSCLPPTCAPPPGSVWELGTPQPSGNSQTGRVGDRCVALAMGKGFIRSSGWALAPGPWNEDAGLGLGG